MNTFNISKTYTFNNSAGTKLTQKFKAVCRMFGLTIDQLKDKQVSINCQLKVNPGDIIYITGPSGSGKTLLLKQLEKAIPKEKQINLSNLVPPSNKAAIDCIDADLITSLRAASLAGLGDAFYMLTKAGQLSEGQKYRLQLAMALAKSKLSSRNNPREFIFADEFCSNLDRITAAVISTNLHRVAKRYKVTFILASSHQDILFDLEPDCIIERDLTGQTKVIYKCMKETPHLL